jgi:ATP-binding cassette subfamily B (MDR/TAP) protein 1
MEPKLAGMLVSLTPAYLIMAMGGGYFVQRYFGQSMKSTGEASSVALEAFSNTTLVHAFSANARLEESFVSKLSPSLKAGVLKSVAMAVQAGLLYFIAFSANALAFWQGSREIADAIQYDTSGVTVGAVFTVILILVDGMYSDHRNEWNNLLICLQHLSSSAKPLLFYVASTPLR